MSLLNTAAGVGENQATTEAENMQTANAILNKPKKVSSRPVEPVPAPSGRVSNDALVTTQLDRVLATDGPLIKRARSDGFALAAERGLNNSSIGVQAGEEAMIRQALPIAQQDAQSYFTADENNLGRVHQSNMQAADHQFQSGENSANRSHQAGMQSNEFTFNAKQNELTRAQQMAVMDKEQNFSSTENKLSREQQLAVQKGEQSFQAEQQYKQNSFSSSEQDKQNSFASTQQGAAHGYQLEEIKANSNEQIRIAASQVDSKFQAQYMESATNLQKAYMEQQAALYNNPNKLTAAQVTNGLNIAKQNFESSTQWLQGVYNQGGTKISTAAFPSAGAAGIQLVGPQRVQAEQGNYAQSAEDIAYLKGYETDTSGQVVNIPGKGFMSASEALARGYLK